MWDKRTKETWQAWSTMPHCVLWIPADWRFALCTLEPAALVHNGESKLATELRNREKVMGSTRDFLRDMRIVYVDPEPESAEPAAVIDITDYRTLRTHRSEALSPHRDNVRRNPHNCGANGLPQRETEFSG